MKRFAAKTTIAFLIIAIIVTQTVAMAAPRAQSAVPSQTTAIIDLALGRTLQLSAHVLPADASQRTEWKTSSSSVATVSKTGLVTAKKIGKVTIYVRPYGVNKISKCSITIIDSLRPTGVTLSVPSLTLTIGQETALTASVIPSTADPGIRWESSSSSIASVSSTGTVLGKKAGKTQIRARSTRNTSVYKSINVTVTSPAIPTRIEITPDTSAMAVGEKLTLTATAVPDTAGAAVSWKTSSSSIATVSSSGVVTARKTGTVKITATSKYKSSVKTVRTIRITDPNKITGVKIAQTDMFLGISDTVDLNATLSPVGAMSNLAWTSSNPNAVSVSANGQILARNPGTATIVVKAEKSGHTDNVIVTVLDTTRTTVVPEQTTTTSEINANLAKIDAIRISAYNELDFLLSKREIASTDASRRKNAIINAFAMYRFPWMTSARQNYWSTADETKAYKPGYVYYGMPYIQCGAKGNYTNRRYNVTSAVSGGYFTKSSAGYFMMNPTKKLNSFYVGNDCSSFVSMSTWGTGHSASFLNTTAMYTSTYYKTITGSNNMRPGDALVKSGVHTVMFLYYTNDAKTQMMIIEQGGGNEPNTVACRVKNVASYITNGYIIRRATIF